VHHFEWHGIIVFDHGQGYEHGVWSSSLPLAARNVRFNLLVHSNVVVGQHQRCASMCLLIYDAVFWSFRRAIWPYTVL